jgi:hypothetical protein
VWRLREEEGSEGEQVEVRGKLEDRGRVQRSELEGRASGEGRVQVDASGKGVRLEECGVQGEWRRCRVESYSRCREGRVTEGESRVSRLSEMYHMFPTGFRRAIGPKVV